MCLKEIRNENISSKWKYYTYFGRSREKEIVENYFSNKEGNKIEY